MLAKTLIAWMTFLVVLIAGDFSYGATLKTGVAERVSFPRYELRTAPVALAARWLTLDAGYRLNRKFATGPALVKYDSRDEYGNMFLPNFNGYAIGWFGNYYFNTVVRDGWYLSAHGYFESYRSIGHAYPKGSYMDREGLRANSAIGYRWKSNFPDIMLGLGGELRSHRVNERRMSFASPGPGTLIDLERDEQILGLFVELKAGFEL